MSSEYDYRRGHGAVRPRRRASDRLVFSEVEWVVILAIVLALAFVAGSWRSQLIAAQARIRVLEARIAEGR